MPQHRLFPHLASGEPRRAVDALISLCKDVPTQGEPFKAFRARLRERNMWDKEKLDDTLRFFRMANGDLIVPSEVMKTVAAAESRDDARVVLAERLWFVNPILFKVVLDRLLEGVQPRDELVTFVDSFAYTGEKVGRAGVEQWLHFAQGVSLIKRLGVAFALADGSERFVELAKHFEIQEFLEEDEEEKLPDSIADAAALGESVDEQAAPTETPSGLTQPSQLPDSGQKSQFTPARGRQRAIQLAQFASEPKIPKQVLADTTLWIGEWWKEQTSPPEPLSVEDFGISSESWMEGSEEVLYRVSVIAALVFRLQKSQEEVKKAYEALDSASVLDDLYYGTAPESLPDDVDSKALMLASLVARRCAESQDLAAELERQKSGHEAFAVLDEALGRGLFKLELFWIMRALSELGAIRFDDLEDFTALPTRLVRDTIFRLGFVDSPYAHDSAALIEAARAARNAAGEAAPADAVLEAFATSAGCTYDCAHRKKCEYACRERVG